MAKKAKKKPLDLTLPIYQLKISLEHIDPPIWRRVQTDDCSLDELHDIIQIAMGWEDDAHARLRDRRRGIRRSQTRRRVRIRFPFRSLERSRGAGPYSLPLRLRLRGRLGAFHRDREDPRPPKKASGILDASKASVPARPRTAAVPMDTPTCSKKSKTPSTKNMRKPWNGSARTSIPRSSTWSKVNEELYHFRRWLGRRQGKERSPSGILPRAIWCG